MYLYRSKLIIQVLVLQGLYLIKYRKLVRKTCCNQITFYDKFIATGYRNYAISGKRQKWDLTLRKTEMD